ncbi:hypothetical protein [Bacillus thuringiensis]|uniref:hypothetical protein n=1 Tax=Bacillus thuringiensis TaxID=1428 RepID=UPI0015C4FDF3|nr:hypothetical protein [Bacillus thuringiensis]
MLEKHEILGTDKSIYEKQGEQHFDYEEIIHLNVCSATKKLCEMQFFLLAPQLIL